MAASICRPAARAARLLSATAPLRNASTAATTPVKPASAPAAPPVPSSNPLESSYSDLSTLSELDDSGTDWTRSFAGLSSSPFSKEAANVLLAPLDPLDVEIKPDGIVYLPEIKYRRILNRAFGPGGWGLAPRGPASVAGKAVSREYALVCLGRLVSVARGEQTFFDPSGVATAAEGAKSNALMRCCKDLGIASELWDPRFIREFKRKHAVDVWVKSAKTSEKKKMWRLKDSPPISQYPWSE